MRSRLQGDQRLIDAIVPKEFNVGCRRPTPGNGYLEALLQPNVHVFTDMFQKVTEKGFIDAEGKEHEVDILICATYALCLSSLFSTISLSSEYLVDSTRRSDLDSLLSHLGRISRNDGRIIQLIRCVLGVRPSDRIETQLTACGNSTCP